MVAVSLKTKITVLAGVFSWELDVYRGKGGLYMLPTNLQKPAVPKVSGGFPVWEVKLYYGQTECDTQKFKSPGCAHASPQPCLHKSCQRVLHSVWLTWGTHSHQWAVSAPVIACAGSKQSLYAKSNILLRSRPLGFISPYFCYLHHVGKCLLLCGRGILKSLSHPLGRDAKLGTQGSTRSSWYNQQQNSTFWLGPGLVLT